MNTTDDRIRVLEGQVRELQKEVNDLKDQAKINLGLINELIVVFNTLSEKMANAAGVLKTPPRIHKGPGIDQK